MDILIKLFILIVGIYVSYELGKRNQRRVDNIKRKKDFYLPYYEDLWMVVQNVNGVIQRNRRINHDKVMSSIKDKYSCGDINSYLTKCVQTDDEGLKTLLIRFSENLIGYRQSIERIQYHSMGDGKINFMEISDAITHEIQNNIEKHLTY